MNENATIVGFDLGHGDTALATTRLATTDEPRVLSVYGMKTIPTMVSLYRNGRVAVGEVSGTGDIVESYERFKSADVSEGGRAAQATRLFVQAITAALQDERQVTAIEDAHFFVGHPSGWSPAAVDGYRVLLMGSGLARVDVVPESRAAFIHARESGELNLSMDELASRVLIIDFGSSTTDFTAAFGLDAQPLDFGHSALGAGIIEGLIMQRMTQSARDPAAVAAALARLPGRATEFAHKCRIAKERYFNKEKTESDPIVEDVVKIDRQIVVDIELTRSGMERILQAPSRDLNGLSWKQALDDCLRQCHRQVDDPDLVIMTGGAARMGFVRQAVETVFARSRIVMSQEPEFAISKGLALYGRLLLKTAAFRAVVDTLVQTPEFAQIIVERLPALIRLQAVAVAEGLAEAAIRPAITAWRDNAVDVRTIDDIGRRIARDCDTWTQSPDAKVLIAQAVVEWLETIRIRLEILTDPVCERFGISKRAMSLKGQPVWDATGSSVATPDVIGNMSVVQTTVSAIAAILMAKVMVALHILLSAHPIGWAVAIVASVVGAIVGVEEAKKLLQGAVIPGFLRRLMISDSKVDQMVTDASVRIRDQLETQLIRNEETAADGERLADKLRQQISLAVRHRADDAILLLR